MAEKAQQQAPVKDARKPWVKKTAVEIFLDQIAKQEKHVAQLEAQLVTERRELEKLQAAKKVLEAK